MKIPKKSIQIKRNKRRDIVKKIFTNYCKEEHNRKQSTTQSRC